MNIYVTNLPDSSERRKSITEQFADQQLNFSFFPCVIGKDLSESELIRLCDLKAIAKHNEIGNWFTKGIIGCTLTCNNFYKNLANSDLDYALYVEDDAKIPKNFKKILDHVESFIQQGDVILLYWLSWKEIEFERKIYDSPFKFAFHEPINSKTLTGGTCQVVTKEAAKKMLELNTPVHITPDCWDYFKNKGAISRLICTVPPCVDVVDFKSTMNLGNYKRIRVLIYKYKIFLPIQYIISKYKKYLRRKKQVYVVKNN